MKKKQVKALSKQLLPSLTGYEYDGWMLFAKPVGQVLRGFDFDTSGFDADSFYLSWFYMPLYVPKEHIGLTLGNRLGSGWNVNEPDLVEKLLEVILNEGLPALEGTETPRGVADVTERNWPEFGNPHITEAIAASWAMAGEFDKAEFQLDRLLIELEPTRDWERAIQQRASKLKRLIHETPEEIPPLLADWEQFTRDQLKFYDE